MSYGKRVESREGSLGNRKFGVNNFKLKEIRYNPNGGAKETASDVLDIVFDDGSDKGLMKRIFPIDSTKDLLSYGKTLKKGTKEFEEELEYREGLLSAAILDLLYAVVGNQEKVDKSFSREINSFRDFAILAEKVAKSNPNWNKVEVGVFLQYQFSIKTGQERTYLEIPTDNAKGKVYAEALSSDFVENKDGGGLRYVNSEGEEYAIKRDAKFMATKFATQQELKSSKENKADMYTSEEEDEDPFA